MKTSIAVYAGSFDPITNGHTNIIERASKIFDELIILIGYDNRKNYTFSLEERIEMVKIVTKDIPNVKIDVCINQYLVNQAKNLGASNIVRGIRTVKDLEDEQVLAEENRMICPFIETVWIPCLPSLSHVSSSMVKGHVGIDPEWEYQVLRSVHPFVVEKLKEKYLKKRAMYHWDKIASMYNFGDISNEIFDDLYSRYSNKNRHHHNIEHIVSMLDELELINENDLALFMSIWLHDIVYDPKRRDNEELSAKYSMYVSEKLGLPGGVSDRIYNYIISTKHKGEPEEYFNKLLLDLDISIFGKNQIFIEKYEEGIRKEYSFAPIDKYLDSRIFVLNSFLNRSELYFTDYFKGKYELKARENLEKLINLLQLSFNELYDNKN